MKKLIVATIKATHQYTSRLEARWISQALPCSRSTFFHIAWWPVTGLRFFSCIITIMANTICKVKEFTEDVYETIITGCTESDSLEGK